MALTREYPNDAEGGTSILPANEATTGVGASSSSKINADLLCGWKSNKEDDDNDADKAVRRSTAVTARTSASSEITMDSTRSDPDSHRQELLCGWKHSPDTQRSPLKSPLIKAETPTSSTDPQSSTGSLPEPPLICEWKHTATNDMTTTSPPANGTSPDERNDMAAAREELLCGWNHNKTALPAPTTRSLVKEDRAKSEGDLPCDSSRDNNNNNEADDSEEKSGDFKGKGDELLCGWNHDKTLPPTPKELTTRSRRRDSFVKEGRANSVPDLFGDDSSHNNEDDQNEEEGGRGFFARVGSSMRNLFAEQPQEQQQQQEQECSPKSNFPTRGGRPALQRGFQSERINRKKLMRKVHSVDSAATGASSFDAANDDEEDGVVTYMGKQYSAKDIFERCNNSRSSTRTNYSNNDSNATLSSFDEDDDDMDEDESEKEGIGRFLVRGLSSLKLGVPESDTRSLSNSNHQLRRPKALPRSKSHGGFQYPHHNNSPRRSLSPPPQRNSTWDRRSRSPPQAIQRRSLSSRRMMTTDDHLNVLQVDPNDVLDITESPQDFAALKRTLKKNKAITNGLLQQGFHVFVHQQKQQRQKQQQQQRERERVNGNSNSSSSSRGRARSKERASPTRITRPTVQSRSGERISPTVSPAVSA